VTEAEWLAFTDPQPMLEFLRGKASDRKLRLFGVACCRRVWPLLTDGTSRLAVEVSESYADGAAARHELREAWAHATGGAAVSSLAEAAMRVAEDEPEKAAWVIGRAFRNSRWNKEQRIGQAFLARDIFGKPFRPVSLNPTWRTPQVMALAQAAYEHRDLLSGHLDPARLAVLADALEDAGCTDAELLGHLRGPGPHVRGCWAVDLLLGKQ
jgi:hypothetical protein